MKTVSLRIRLDEDFARLLERAAREAGRSRSEIAREFIGRQLRLMRLDAIRRRIMPLAQARGFLTDRDVFGDIS